jgi:hypothetical protein
MRLTKKAPSIRQMWASLFSYGLLQKILFNQWTLPVAAETFSFFIKSYGINGWALTQTGKKITDNSSQQRAVGGVGFIHTILVF